MTRELNKDTFFKETIPLIRAIEWIDKVEAIFGPESASELSWLTTSYVNNLLDTYFKADNEKDIDKLYERFYEELNTMAHLDSVDQRIVWSRFYDEFKGI